MSDVVGVAGGTGMTGDAVVRQLLAADPSWRVRATYRSVPPDWQDARVEWVQADLCQRADCDRAFAGCSVAVLSAASTGGAAAAASDPERQLTDNLVMDAYQLEAAHRAGVRRLVYLSSATVYQEFTGAIPEDQLDLNAEPHSAYLGVGWAKRAAEKLCRFWHVKHGHEVIILRCANIYGPRAKFDPARANFIPALVRKAVDRLEPFEVWGSPGVQRDVIYVEDAARAVVAALTATAAFDIFNLGTGVPVTVDEVVRAALAAAGHTPRQVLYREQQPGTIAVRALDCRKLQQTLAWHPQVSLTEGIRRTTAWWQAHKTGWKR